MCTAIENQMKGKKNERPEYPHTSWGAAKKIQAASIFVRAYTHIYIDIDTYNTHIRIPCYPICVHVIKPCRIEWKKDCPQSRFTRENSPYREDRKAKNIFASQNSYVNACAGCTARKGADLAARFSQIYELPLHASVISLVTFPYYLHRTYLFEIAYVFFNIRREKISERIGI